MNKKFKLFLIVIILFTITVNVNALDPNNYVTGNNEQPTTEQQEDNKIDVVDKNELEAHKIKEEKNGNKIVIEDEAELLTPEQIKSLKEKMEPITEYGNVAFKTINNNNTSTEYYAQEYFYSLFNDGEDAVLFLIDMDNRIIYMYSDGDIHRKYITNSKSKIITDNAYKYASNQDYYGCASTVFEQTYTVLEGGKIAEPMRHASNIVIAIVVAFFINFLIVLGASKIKSVRKEEILKNCDNEFSLTNLEGKRSGTRRKYSPISESSGSGFSGGGHSGGGGFSGGGGHSGGGGGHSF